MRGENYQAAIRDGLNVTSVHGNMFIPPDELLVFDDTTSMGTADWVLVALKSSALAAIPPLVAPLLTPQTRVLVIMNGMIEDDLLDMMKAETGQTGEGPLACCQAWYGGMALICSNKIRPGHVDHSYAGLLSAGTASTQSPESSAADEDRKAFQDLWSASKVDIAYEESLLRGRWKKMIWNLPFNGISVAMGGISVDKIVTDPGLRRLAEQVMNETVLAANTDLKQHCGAGNYEPLGESDKYMMSRS
jgi:2-dehydropantoate 2-reductase